MNMESPVFLNKLKLEKIDIKSNESRKNEHIFLLENNKSSVFQNSKIDKYSKLNKTSISTLNTKTKTQNTSISTYKNSNKTISLKNTIRKSIIDKTKPWPFKDNVENPKKIRITVEKFEFDPKQTSETKLNKRDKTPKEKRLEHSYSNIFNDKNKSFEKYEKLEKKQNLFINSPVKYKSKFSDFNKNKVKSVESKRIFSKTHGYRTLDEDDKKPLIKKNLNTTTINNKPKPFAEEKKSNNLPFGTDNEKIVKDLMGKNFSKARFNLSKLHPDEFYRKSLRSQTQDRKVETYQIRNIDINFDEEKFKKIYKHSGIHIYELNINSYRNDKGILEFKVRKNCDIDDYNNNLSLINKKVQEEFHVNLELTNKAARPRSLGRQDSNVSRNNNVNLFDTESGNNKFIKKKFVKAKNEKLTVKNLLTLE